MFLPAKTPTISILVLALCGACQACKKADDSPKASASAAALASDAPAATTDRAKMDSKGQVSNFDQVRAEAKAKIEKPPLKPPADALSAPGGVRWQLVSNGHEPPLTGDDALNADTTVWTSDGTKAVSSFELPQVGTIKLTSVSEQFRDLLGRLKPPAIARYWIPKAALEGWRPERWPDEDIIVQVNAYSVARSNQPLGAWGPKPAASGPPEDAKTSVNGYRHKLLERGSGTQVPDREPITLVWSAWAVEGLVVRKLSRSPQQTQTTLDKVPGGLGPVVKTMTLGETRRIWVPKSKAGSITPDAEGLDLVVDLLVTK